MTIEITLTAVLAIVVLWAFRLQVQVNALKAIKPVEVAPIKPVAAFDESAIVRIIRASHARNGLGDRI